MLLDAYRKTQSRTASPRATEHRLLSEITSEMIEARTMGLSGAALMPPLHRNRQVWSVLSALCGAPENQLPATLRASIMSLALWVGRYTSQVVNGSESLDALIEVNTTVMEGLAVEHPA
ncbi:flagellar biosynthesis regulator FlaF [Sphingomonas endophytica]|uniref:Flagellar protein FlaF n=1 Tax=Sphingomonas endophytica TaxID=869719 RepID=A0A7X0MNH7_9SPHN|nr:flagellar biosynthesis regulator FlaF [Sphingomonas endophytica]MBB5725669.1 flagellar protein FlaF [Sphingomonas endophytica]MBB6505369.1 flagellar protein FlaF [Sphingomonas endophytica]